MTITHLSRSGTDPFVQASQRFLPLLDLLAEARCRRRIRRSYGQMSEAQLCDIGLRPLDVATALSMPLSESAESALVRAAAREAARW